MKKSVFPLAVVAALAILGVVNDKASAQRIGVSAGIGGVHWMGGGRAYSTYPASYGFRSVHTPYYPNTYYARSYGYRTPFYGYSGLGYSGYGYGYPSYGYSNYGYSGVYRSSVPYSYAPDYRQNVGVGVYVGRRATVVGVSTPSTSVRYSNYHSGPRYYGATYWR